MKEDKIELIIKEEDKDEIKEKNEIESKKESDIKNEKEEEKLQSIQLQEEESISTSVNINDLRLGCPECDLIPALFFDIKSRNIYRISAACENKHLINNMPVKTYFKKCMKLKNDSKENLKDFICMKHNSNYNSFCKTCKKNICKECSDTEHNNHFISQFYELLPSNEEIIQLKNSIDNEINDVNIFLMETFHKWINELQEKFHELIENIKCKNKLYNFIINFYETKEFNYQNIYNIKTVAENQIKRNPLTQEIQTLKNIITRNEQLLLNNKNKEEDEELKEKYLKLKSAQILKILNILNSDVNSNYKFIPFNSTEKSLQNYLEDKKDPSNLLNDYVVINPYNKSKTYNEIYNNKFDNINNDEKNKDKSNNLTLNEKMDLANELKLTKRKVYQNIPQESKVHCLTVLKDYKGNLTNRFATGLENGNINIYYVDPKTNNIYLDFDIREHTKAVSYITCLHDGRILTCSQDNTMKLFEETISYSYLLSFWKRYYLIQTLINPNVDPKEGFHPVSVIEMSNNTLVSGDWKNIIIWKLIKKSEKKHKKREKINFSFDIDKYNGNKYNYYYEIYKEIKVSTSVTSLLSIDAKSFVSAHFGGNIVTFYNITDDSKKTLEKIKCVDSATQCMAIIEVQKPENNWQKDKIIIVGGYKCIYLLSVKQQNLIDKITLPGNDHIRYIINSGIMNNSNGFICGGYFNQSSYDIVHYNTKCQLGFSELVVNEVSRINHASNSEINSIIFLKKNIYDESLNPKNIIVIIGGNEECIKTYVEVEEEGED